MSVKPNKKLAIGFAGFFIGRTFWLPHQLVWRPIGTIKSVCLLHLDIDRYLFQFDQNDYRSLDMARSATNMLGNALATAVVSKWEGELKQ